MAAYIFEDVIKEIEQIIEKEELFLNGLDGETISTRLNSQNRSIKQIVGHMIDSASNNLHRVVHLHYGANPLVFPNYATNGNNDRWIGIQHFQEEDWQTLVQLWKYSNLHFVHVIKHVDAQKLNNKWIAGEGEEVSLQDMIRDYPRHLELHMSEVHALHELR